MGNTLIGEIIAEEAAKHEGEQEIKGNMGFKNSRFDRLMRSVGFRDGHAWCVYFCELVYKRAYEESDPRKLPLIKSLFTAGAVRTFRRFKESDEWETGSIPRVGAVAIWQKYNRSGKATSYGHAAIVIKNSAPYAFRTMEGNTNDKGGREGYIVAEKIRRINFDDTRGLVLLGFIYPKGIEGSDV